MSLVLSIIMGDFYILSILTDLTARYWLIVSVFAAGHAKSRIVHSIVLKTSDSSPKVCRQDLWQLCADQKWKMSKPKEYNRHGVEDIGDGTFSINLIDEYDISIARSKLHYTKPFFMLVKSVTSSSSNSLSDNKGFDLRSGVENDTGQCVLKLPFEPFALLLEAYKASLMMHSRRSNLVARCLLIKFLLYICLQQDTQNRVSYTQLWLSRPIPRQAKCADKICGDFVRTRSG